MFLTCVFALIVLVRKSILKTAKWVFPWSQIHAFGIIATYWKMTNILYWQIPQPLCWGVDYHWHNFETYFDIRNQSIFSPIGKVESSLLLPMWFGSILLGWLSWCLFLNIFQSSPIKSVTTMLVLFLEIMYIKNIPSFLR